MLNIELFYQKKYEKIKRKISEKIKKIKTIVEK